jgi:hypothetical protein
VPEGLSVSEVGKEIAEHTKHSGHSGEQGDDRAADATTFNAWFTAIGTAADPPTLPGTKMVCESRRSASGLSTGSLFTPG